MDHKEIRYENVNCNELSATIKGEEYPELLTKD
jgi:hypothetical protein